MRAMPEARMLLAEATDGDGVREMLKQRGRPGAPSQETAISPRS
jgi:hypothetical protein